MRKKIATVFATMAIAVGCAATIAVANPSAPTNGGNGAGQSGQCTGAAADRPTSCHSK